MKLIIVSPQHKEQHMIEWLHAQTPEGSLVIKHGHAPLIATLVEKSELSFLLKTGETITIHLIRPGFLEVDRTSITALINQATMQ